MKNLLISIKITLSFCVVLFVGYVAILWGVAFFTQPNGGQAQVIELDGQVVGAAGVGQQFSDSIYFWGRPSVVAYNGAGSGGSNKAVSNPEYLSEVETRIDAFLAAHPYLNRSQVPAEMVTASGSGLDPHISASSAKIQAQRVAAARGMEVQDVEKVIESVQQDPFFTYPIINVLKLNVALDKSDKSNSDTTNI